MIGRLLKAKKAISVPNEIFNIDRVEARSKFFSEMQSYWNIPLNETTIISDLAVTKGKLPAFIPIALLDSSLGSLSFFYFIYLQCILSKLTEL